MKCLILSKDGKISYEQREAAKPAAGEVMIKVKACGVCGTDMHVYKGMANSWGLPGIIGHEFYGEICDSNGCEGISAGDIVTVQPLLHCGECRFCKEGRTNLCPNIRLIGGERPGALCEYVCVPKDAVVSKGFNESSLVVAEPVATVVHGLSKIRQERVKNAVIFGAGSLGLIALQIMTTFCDNIIVCDIVDSRLERALRLGATHVVNSKDADALQKIIDITGGDKADLTVDAAGANPVRKLAFESIRSGGEMLFIALGAPTYEVNFLELVTREISIYGTQCHTLKDFDTAIDYLKTGVVSIDEVVTFLQLEDGAKVFEVLANNPDAYTKVAFKVDGE